MGAKVTYVHFGANESEIGIQFEADDGAGGKVTGRMFAPANAATKQAVLDAAQADLDAATGALPVDMPPEAITTALMKKRNAEQEAAKASARKLAADEAAAKAQAFAQDAEAKRAQAELEKAALDVAIAEATAKKAAIEAEIAAAKAAADEPAAP